MLLFLCLILAKWQVAPSSSSNAMHPAFPAWLRLPPPPPAQAAGITIPAGATWTIFAPTNDAFNDDDVREATGLTAAQLLEPANRQALAQVGHKLC